MLIKGDKLSQTGKCMRNETAGRLGRFVETAVGGERVKAFVPPPLPPNPPLEITGLLTRLSAAERALGRLDGVSILLPNKELFLYMYVRKEAVLSSQIEGTQSTLSDLLRFETEAISGEPVDDIREVSNYVDAMMFGLERMRQLPLSLRLIREMHQRLLDSGRGGRRSPGEFRTSQNWIGGTRPGNAMFVPPPANEVMTCLGDWERFIHEETPSIPPLIKAGLIHVQFETIHPFLDGNGRLGRLLITLFLCATGVLQQPLLYLSLYFKSRRPDYYRLLQEVREYGTWEAWLEFFLDGVAETADQAFETANRIARLFHDDREWIVRESERTGSVLQIHEIMRTSPYLTAASAAKRSGLTVPTVNAALDQLQRLGVVEEATGRRRGRVFVYRAYMDILSDGAGTNATRS
ncbi:Fic family protein [Sinorhizobium meliloti]|nr:Fic family protein [Sinorhizobium meliloti]MDW9476867.1 winged helix-turn-helix transcriptional regulator [Sinorhizobium meliloti]MDX0016783.1 winged helix-turn-helix transcriptional regulator [Sinorhizobium meliloti]MDX0305315.1 winged helix-turn-helix transcriptional regulator [Sinorhizobium meliloti]MDX0373472.1 winged helix-turn-helix transcriptional regulator [Sinorhizobium meliloti]